MEIGIFVILLLLWCLLFAVHEANIEGPNGWAKELPTAKYVWDEKEGKMYFKAFNSNTYTEVDHTTWPGKLYFFYINTILGGKDYTDYHRIIDLLQLFVSHLLVYVCFLSLGESIIVLEVRALAGLMLIWSIEDTLWFYVNPCASQSGHHKDWLMIGQYRLMEKGMSLNFIGGLILLVLSFFLSDIWQWLMTIV